MLLKIPLFQVDYANPASNVFSNAVIYFLQEDLGGTEHRAPQYPADGF